MKEKRYGHLRIVKNDLKEKKSEFNQALKDVHRDMEQIIELINSSIEKEGPNPLIAK